MKPRRPPPRPPTLWGWLCGRCGTKGWSPRRRIPVCRGAVAYPDGSVVPCADTVAAIRWNGEHALLPNPGREPPPPVPVPNSAETNGSQPAAVADHPPELLEDDDDGPEHICLECGLIAPARRGGCSECGNHTIPADRIVITGPDGTIVPGHEPAPEPPAAAQPPDMATTAEPGAVPAIEPPTGRNGPPVADDGPEPARIGTAAMTLGICGRCGRPLEPDYKCRQCRGPAAITFRAARTAEEETAAGAQRDHIANTPPPRGDWPDTADGQAAYERAVADWERYDRRQPEPEPATEPEPAYTATDDDGGEWWQTIRAEYEETRRDRPPEYSAAIVRARLLKAVPDARLFPIRYEPGRVDKEGKRNELVRPRGWLTTIPGTGDRTHNWKTAIIPGWLLGPEWCAIDIDDVAAAAPHGITPARLRAAGAMVVATPGGGCHGWFRRAEGQSDKSRIRPAGDSCGWDWLAGDRYAYAPHGWRPEHYANDRLKPPGQYWPLWPPGQWNPQPLPAALYAAAMPNRAGAVPGGGSHNRHPRPGETDGRDSWAKVKDAAVRIRQAFPGITADECADQIWERMAADPEWVPNTANYEWDRPEILRLVGRAWADRTDWETANPQQTGGGGRRRGTAAARRMAKRKNEAVRSRPPAGRRTGDVGNE